MLNRNKLDLIEQRILGTNASAGADVKLTLVLKK